jgi:NAD(P)-dependent dehydrogenase (short-subunit alcohol dehydrogenase family)
MSDNRREIAGKTVLLSGASGGIGRELVRAFLGAGAAEVIAASRTPDDASDSRVRAHALDVTDDASVAAAAAAFAERVDILVNCAGANANSRIFLPPALEGAREEMDVNYFGLLRMVRAFAPAMQRRRQGAIVNMLSMVSLVNVPRMATYCASKAAAYSLTQAIRAELMPYGIHVCTMLPSATDTPMSAHLSIPKLKPATVADAVIAAIRDGIEDAHEGLIHEEIYQGLRTDPKSIERQMAAKLGHTN